MRVKAANQLSNDVQTLDFGPGYSLTESNGDVAVSSNGSLSSVRYRLASDGTNVTAYDQTGSVISAGTDGGAVLTACLPAAASVGATIDFRNDGQVFPWATTPALPKGITGKLTIRGNGSTVKLSSSAPRFLDFNKVADGDTFQNIEIDGFVIDANSVGGKHHIVLGGWASGAWLTKVNLDRITVRRVKVLNAVVGTDSTVDFRIGLALVCSNDSGDAKQTLTNLVIEDFDVAGSLSGIVIAGIPSAGGTSNVYIDGVNINRWRVVRSAAPTAFISGGQDILIGNKGNGGQVTISNGYGYGSPDVGIECDGMGDANIENCVIEDAWNVCFFHTNFTPAASTQIATLNYRGCTGLRTSVTNSQAGWKWTENNSNPIQSVRLSQCAYLSTCTSIDTPPSAIIPGGSTQINRLIVQEFRAEITGWTWQASNALLTWQPISLSPSTTLTSNITLRNVTVKVAGTRDTSGGANSLITECLKLGGQANVVIDGYDCDCQITGGSNSSTKVVAVTGSCGATGLNLDVRGVRLLAVAGDTAPQGFRFGNTASGVLINQRASITGFDFSAGPAGTVEISYQTAGQNNDKVVAFNNVWRTKPAPTTLTGLVTATGLQVKTGYPVMLTLTQGSGTAITAIDYSTDGGTHYTNFLTQASGALPAGFDQSLGPLTSLDLVKVTFTGTQPTINLVPVNP